MIFFGKIGRNIEGTSNEVLCASNGSHMPNLHPWEVDVPFYPNEAHSFGASSPRVRVFDV